MGKMSKRYMSVEEYLADQPVSFSKSWKSCARSAKIVKYRLKENLEKAGRKA